MNEYVNDDRIVIMDETPKSEFFWLVGLLTVLEIEYRIVVVDYPLRNLSHGAFLHPLELTFD